MEFIWIVINVWLIVLQPCLPHMEQVGGLRSKNHSPHPCICAKQTVLCNPSQNRPSFVTESTPSVQNIRSTFPILSRIHLKWRSFRFGSWKECVSLMFCALIGCSVFPPPPTSILVIVTDWPELSRSCYPVRCHACEYVSSSHSYLWFSSCFLTIMSMALTRPPTLCFPRYDTEGKSQCLWKQERVWCGFVCVLEPGIGLERVGAAHRSS